MKSLFPLVAVAGSCVLAGALAPASAQGGVLSGDGSIVDGTTSEVTSTLDQTLDQVLGGGEGVLSDDALGDVLVTMTSPAPAGMPGFSGSSGSSSAGGSGTRIVSSTATGTTVPSTTPDANDRSAPRARVRIVSRLSRVARTRRLRLEVRSDEPGVVAIASAIRPGHKRRGVAKRVRHKRSVIHVPTVVLAFRRAGTMTVDLRLKASEAAKLGRSKNGRMSVALLTADVSRNQSSKRLKRHLRR